MSLKNPVTSPGIDPGTDKIKVCLKSDQKLYELYMKTSVRLYIDEFFLEGEEFLLTVVGNILQRHTTDARA